MRRLLVPLDGSDRGDQVLDFVDRVLPQLRSHQLVLMRVVSPGEALDAASERLDAAAARSRDCGLATASLAVLGESPAAEIVKVADLVQASLVVLSTHGSGGSNEKRGSVAAAVIGDCPVPVLLVGQQALPLDPRPGLRRIVVALDGSRGADAVLPVVSELARPNDVEVVLLTVTGGEPAADLEAARDHLRTHGVGRVRVRTTKGPVIEALLEAARAESADILAIGARGQTGGKGLGSVAGGVARSCDIPLLVVR